MLNKDQKDLLKEMEIRFKTLMIGSIARFEQNFGYLWNHGKEPETDNQHYFRDKWDDLRIDLLNHGNNQIRLALDELFDYLRSDTNYKYNYYFKIKQDKTQGDL
jgi:hypothetical protein